MDNEIMKNAIINRHGYVRRRAGDIIQICFDPTPRGHNVRDKDSAAQRAKTAKNRNEYKNMATAKLWVKCADRMIIPEGSCNHIIDLLRKDDEDITQERGAILKFRVNKGSGFGAVAKEKDKKNDEDDLPVVKLVPESVGSTTCRLMSYTEVEYVLRKNPSIVEFILCSVPVLGKHGSIGVRLYSTLQSILKEKQDAERGASRGGHDDSADRSALGRHKRNAMAAIHIARAFQQSLDFVGLRDEAELLCNELHQLAEGEPLGDEDIKDDEKQKHFDCVARAAAAAIENIREWRLLFVVQEWLEVSPSCSSLEYMIKRLEQHCKEEEQLISESMRRVAESLKVKIRRVLGDGHKDGNLDLFKLASNSDLTANEKLEVLIVAMAPEHLPEEGELVNDWVLLGQMNKIHKRVGEMLGEKRAVADPVKHEDVPMNDRIACVRCGIYKLTSAFSNLDQGRKDRAICRECRAHQGFLFGELVAFLGSMPVSVVDRVLSDIHIDFDEVERSVKRRSDDDESGGGGYFEALDFFGSSLPIVLELQRVINNSNERRFLSSEIAFARILQNLREAKEESAHGNGLLENTLDEFESTAMMWWTLRICRHLMKPFRAHSFAHGEKLREVFVERGKGSKMEKVKSQSRFHSHLSISKTVSLWWTKFKQDMDLDRVDDSSDDDDEDLQKTGAQKIKENAAKRLDGLLNYHEFEMLLCASGGASLGCDRGKMHRLFNALDCCGSGKVSNLEVSEVSQALRKLCQGVRSKTKSWKLNMIDVRQDIRSKFKAMERKHEMPEQKEVVWVFCEKLQTWVEGQVVEIHAPDDKPDSALTSAAGMLQGKVSVKTKRGTDQYAMSDVCRRV
eukprot:gnl/MRDRNA2_/MRDRNA2_65477_c0_seq2.p1 gnl/MRDRNA2_/MRDRNA2_65477_c0~~gnl/MRDRNA2_/MRDRNA2_65477_c0_seq2.p1  ORF type:complete len:962 (+),score=179.09 gnl/MRDRNA2_/MRDRNA2_65477_c0_seq2:342-2888(+)